MNIEFYCYYTCPIGDLLLAGSREYLLLIGLPRDGQKYPAEPDWQYTSEPFQKGILQLDEYFAGRRKSFDFAFSLRGSEFQQRVLDAVAAVPYGTVTNYSAIAATIKQPLAVRAVGGANAANPLPIIIPCHRIIGKNGTLTGFAGGLQIKQYLLQLEGALAAV